MSLGTRLSSLFRNAARRRAVEQDLDDEVRSYVDLLVDEKRQQGMTPDEARREVAVSMGSMEHVKENVRDVRAGAWLESTLRDLRYAARTLWKSPAFTITAALSIALGVGANTGIFTLVNALLFQPIPVADPATLTIVYNTDKGKLVGNAGFSKLNFDDFRQRQRSFTALAASAGPIPLNLSYRTVSVPVFMEFSTPDFFTALGINPAAGRFFAPDEDRTPGAHTLVVLSYGTWQGRFGGAADLVGQTIRLAGQPMTVIGIAPNAFKGLSNFFGPELWVPSSMAGALLADQGRAWLRERESAAFNMVGRLRPGVSREQAEAELKGIAEQLEAEFPTINRNRSVVVRPITEVSVFPGLRDGVLAGSTFLMVVVGLVLLIACSNVANLLLARASVRRHEIAVRLAVGAGRGRIVRQLLTESVLLALVGGALGIAFAAVAKSFLWAQRPAIIAESLVEPRLDLTVLLYALFASVAAGFLFGLVPALQSSVPELSGTLQEEGRASGGRRRRRLANTFVAAQVCFALVCLVVAGLCLRAVESLYDSNPGFETSRLAMVSANPGEAGYAPARSEQYFRDVSARIPTLPGVVSAAWATNPLLFGGPSRGIEIPGVDTKTSVVNIIDPAYFRTVGLPLRKGREFGAGDTARTTPVAIVNEAFAETYWPNGDAIGRRFRFSKETTEREIVGIVKTAALVFLGEPPQACVYLPAAQSADQSMNLYVRTAGTPTPMLEAMQRTLREIDSQVPPQNPMTVRQLMDNNLWIARVIVGLFAALGVLGLALASVGLYGVMAYAVGTRKREIGVRMALGAGRATVVRMVFARGFTVVGLGAAVGLLLSLLAGRAISAAVAAVPALDPLSFGAACALLFGVAGLACWLPARRASRVDPAIALREG
ncbi:MAG: ABC transporter permease [Bryobacteraceae bacterium]|nr:ABC transporter permease [Bryobacteraceae bacterium]